jgi:hypothetical protein
MPLVDKRPPPSPLNIHPLRTTLAVLGSSLVFVVGVALVARLTADGQTRSPREVLGTTTPSVDVTDAGSATTTSRTSSPAVADGRPRNDDGDAGTEHIERDAGVTIVGVSPDAGVQNDAGPPDVAGPPFSASAVVEAAVVVVQACVGDALRWDPSLGGPFALQIDLGPLFVAADGAAPPLVTTPGLTSPVLANCLARRSGDVQLPSLGDVEVPLAVHARAALDAAGRITWSDAVVTTSTSAGMKSTTASE